MPTVVRAGQATPARSASGCANAPWPGPAVERTVGRSQAAGTARGGVAGPVVDRRRAWLATEEVAAELGCVSARWVRRQIEARRLRATVLMTGGRVTYRVARVELEVFRRRYLRDSWDPEWDGEP